MYDLRRDLAHNVIDQTVKMAIKFDGMQESLGDSASTQPIPAAMKNPDFT